MKKVIIGCLLLLFAVPAMPEAGKDIKFSIGQMILFALIALAIMGVCVFLPSFVVFIALNTIFSQQRTYSWQPFALAFIISLIGMIVLSSVTGVEGLSGPFVIITFLITTIVGTCIGWRAAGRRHNKKD